MTENSNVVPFAASEGEQETEAREVRSPHLLEAKRMVEAIVFASAEPVPERILAERLPDGTDVAEALTELQRDYEKRGVNLVRVENSWAFRTASDLSFLMNRNAVQQRKLSRAALEMLAVIAYHQPVTRAEIEEIRGVETSKGTLDILLETGWVKMRGRRRTPGRPVTYGTSTEFLDHFGLTELRDLPGIDELKGAGLLSARMPANFSVPQPMTDPDELTEDEDPLTDIDLEELGLLTPLAEDD
ncbi:chromosome segregation and condensation protein ScpB [Nitratireductor aquibiodomus RA22]|uniref:Chromosome segregation and condensation protein ScpB n=1 Tax=Nitratireductor aquibiodomus RA22 TaxID=1189611 RepID=I5C0I8_9HYPH|nr:SMC-Scp complex subunit ScpB [Nitratireductor aquibiodomus]EIM75340.1 chromosome segregation and condensation protein ScpB [Nitratireductor aquibiodomus RA22]